MILKNSRIKQIFTHGVAGQNNDLGTDSERDRKREGWGYPLTICIYDYAIEL